MAGPAFEGTTRLPTSTVCQMLYAGGKDRLGIINPKINKKILEKKVLVIYGKVLTYCMTV